MKDLFPAVGLERICGLFGRSRQAFYDHSRRTVDEQFNEALILDRVRQIRSLIAGLGGLQLYKMLKEDMSKHKVKIGRDRFYLLLKRHNLLIKRKKRYVITTDSNHPYYKWANLTEGIQINDKEQLWVSDITYLDTVNGFLYLSLITDAWSRKIVGYHLSQKLKAQGCIIALHKAIKSLSTIPEHGKLIHHSDRGIQYCCRGYVEILLQNGIQISMTQSGSPYDNAIAERVNGILKHHIGINKVYKNYSEALAAVCLAIDTYNRIRPHMSLHNLTPEKAHQTTQLKQKKWKKKQFVVKPEKENIYF